MQRMFVGHYRAGQSVCPDREVEVLSKRARCFQLIEIGNKDQGFRATKEDDGR